MAQLRKLAIASTLACFLLVNCFAAFAHGQRERQSGTRTYRGIGLPPAPTIQGTSAHPPPAWLVTGKKATAASYGSFCYAAACVDMIPPSARPDISQVVVPGRQKRFALIPSHVIATAAATLRPWGAQTSPAVAGRTAAVHRRQDGRWTVLNLKLPGTLHDEMLEMHVTFTTGGDASYLWRLNPSS